MGNHRADVTSDSPRSVTPSPGATTSSSYVGKRRAAPATDSPASRPAPRATGSTSYVGKRRAAPSPAVGTAKPSAAPEIPEEPVAKARPNRVVLDQTGKLPVVGSPRDDEATDGRISTGQLRALVEGDGGASFPTTPLPAKPAPRPIVPAQRRAAQIDPVLADLLSSMGIDPDKVTPEVLEDLGVGGMTTSELTMFLTQPNKPAPAKATSRKTVSTKTPPRGVPAAPAAVLPEPVLPQPALPESVLHEPVAPVAPIVPEPTFQAPEPTHTPKPLRMANTFAPLTGKIRAVREARQIPAPPVAPAAPAYEPEVNEPRGFQEAFDAPPASSFKIDTTSFPAPPVALPQQVDFDSMAIDLPAETHTVDAPYYEEPQAHEAWYQHDYADDYHRDPQQAETYFRADPSADSGHRTGSIDLPSISEIATYPPELHDLPAVETTGTMVGIGGPTRPRTRRAAAAAAGGRPTVPLTAGAAALAAAIGGIALTGGPTMVAADDVRLVGATALGGDSDMVVVGDRSATVTRNDERSQADTAASDREKALQGVDVQADKQDKFLKSNMWELPIAAGTYRITGTFGSSGSNWASTHTGLDFATAYGTRIHAVSRGTVTFTGWDGAYGNKTVITMDDGTELWYCHQSDFGVEVGQTVSPGETIGYVGSTGNSTGNHLHLEVRPGGGDAVDPDSALNEHGVDPT